MAATVSAQCHNIIRNLQSVISFLMVGGEPSSQVDQKQVVDELERFSLWVGNIGATHRPESLLSLESRLREASDVLEFISQLLEDLTEVAGELLAIASGERVGESAASNGDTEDEAASDEVTGLLEEIGACVSRLFRVTSLIRQAGPTDTFAKALSRSRYLFSDQYDIAHVGEKFPKLAMTENSWLKARLGRAITHRRRYLSYIHNHHEKLEGHHHNEDMPKEKPHVLMTATQLDTSSRPSTFFTKASSLVPGRITPQMLAAEDQSDAESDAKSYTTISRSVAGDLDTSAISKIPKLDEMRTGTKKEFECPFCYRVKKFKNERVWRQHVFADLRSYVCTFPSCEHPYFSDMNDWFRHELQHHRVVYRCHVCNDRKFDLGERYDKHVRKEHPDMFSIGEEQHILDMARRPLDQIRAQDCPCCSEWVGRLTERAEVVNDASDPSNHTILVDPTVFKRHLASHLEQLALFAVPPGSKEGDADSDAAVEEDANTASSNLGMSSLAFTENIPSPKSSNDAVQFETDSLIDTNHPQDADSTAQSQQSQISHDHVQARKKGASSSDTRNSQTKNMRYDNANDSYHVRDGIFFKEGQVFSVLLRKPIDRAGDSSPTDNDSLDSYNTGDYGGDKVYTSVRTFVSVHSKRKYCYALPIYTYPERATTKRGIELPSVATSHQWGETPRSSAFSIAYEWGKQPQSVKGAIGNLKPSVGIVMAEGCTLPVTSLISYGKHRLVHHIVEAKEIGYVHENDIKHLIEIWGEEDVDRGDDDQEKSKQGEGNSEGHAFEHDVRGFPQEFEEGAKVMMRVSETRMKMFTVAAANRIDKIGWQYQLKMDNSILWNEGSWIGEDHLRRARESDWVDSNSAKPDNDGGELGRHPREESERKEEVQEERDREEDDQETRAEKCIEDEEPKGLVEQATQEGPAQANTEEPERNAKTNKTEEHLTSHQSNPGLQNSETTEMARLLTPEIEASYSTIIDDILRTSDLKTISSKRIRQGLQERIGHDISDHKHQLGKLIMRRFDVLIAIDEILGASDLDTISAKRLREILQIQVDRDVSIENNKVTELVKERFEKIRADDSSINDSRETALPVTTSVNTSDGDTDTIEAQRERSTAGPVQQFEIGAEVDMWIVPARKPRRMKRFSVAAASRDENSRWQYQLRTPDFTLWDGGGWFSQRQLVPTTLSIEVSDLEENILEESEKEEDEPEGDENLSERKQRRDPAFWEGAEVTIAAFDDAVLSPVFFVVASRYNDPDWYYQLKPLSNDDPHDREKWILEEKIKFCGQKARTFDREEDVQEGGGGNAPEGGEENLIDERDNSILDTAGRRIPFEYDRWQTSGHQEQDEDTQDEDTMEGEQPEWADAQLGEEPEDRTEEDFVRWKEQMRAEDTPAKGVDDLEEDRRREIEHQQRYGTEASASREQATPLIAGPSQGGSFSTAETHDHIGVHEGPSSIYNQLTRPSNVGENDEKSGILEIEGSNTNLLGSDALHRKFAIQQDRLIAWGVEWSDESTPGNIDFDKRVRQAGLSETVTSVLATIKEITDEIEKLRTNKTLSGASSWAVADQPRYEDLIKDLTTSIDILYDLSRAHHASRNSGSNLAADSRAPRRIQSNADHVSSYYDASDLDLIDPREQSVRRASAYEDAGDPKPTEPTTIESPGSNVSYTEYTSKRGIPRNETSSINQPTPTGSGTGKYIVQQRQPSKGPSSHDGQKKIIIEFGKGHKITDSENPFAAPASSATNLDNPFATAASKSPVNPDPWENRNLREALPNPLSDDDQDEERKRQRAYAEERERDVKEKEEEAEATLQSQNQSAGAEDGVPVFKSGVRMADSASRSAPRYSKGDMVSMRVTTDNVHQLKHFTIFAVSQKADYFPRYQLVTTEGELWDCGVWVREADLRPRRV